MNFPVLSIITFTPLVAALIILMLPAQRKNEARAVALAAAERDVGDDLRHPDLADARAVRREHVHAVVAVADPAHARPDVAVLVAPDAVGEPVLPPISMLAKVRGLVNCTVRARTAQTRARRTRVWTSVTRSPSHAISTSCHSSTQWLTVAIGPTLNFRWGRRRVCR